MHLARCGARRFRNATCLVLAVIAGQLGAYPARAAGSPATFAVKVTPSDAGQGDFVVISGTSVVDSRTPEVKITVVAPGTSGTTTMTMPAAAAVRHVSPPVPVLRGRLRSAGEDWSRTRSRLYCRYSRAPANGKGAEGGSVPEI